MYKKSNSRWAKHMDFFVLDLILLELAYLVSYYIRIGGGFRYQYSLYQNMQLIILVFDAILFFTMQLHRNILKRSFIREILSSLQNMTILVVVIMAYLYYIKQSSMFSRMIFTLFWGIGTLFLCIGRTLLKLFVRKKLEKSGDFPQMILITQTDRAATSLARLYRHSENRFNICSVVITDFERERDYTELFDKIPDGKNCHVIGGCDEMHEFLKNAVVDEVMIDLADPSRTEQLAKEFLVMGIAVHISLSNVFGDLPNQIVDRVGGMQVLTTSINAASPVQLMLKRAMDIAGAIVGLMITAVAVIIFGPIIYFQSPGPIFYSQVRVGRNGRKFRIYKFRSMVMNADKMKEQLMKENKAGEDGLIFKMDNDPRIIPIGRLIRKLSIDELPQFYNILKGDMSLVGTRPPTEDEWEKYSPHHKARLSFRPGLTGMWQANGRSDITDFEDIVKLDMQYIREWSLKLDIILILKTVQVVVTGKGAE